MKKNKANLSNKCILITGGAGYIGYWFVNELKNTSASKIIVLDKNNKQLERLSRLVMDSRIHSIICDLSNENQVAEAAAEIGQSDIIIHLAATLSTSKDVGKDGHNEYINNVLPLINLLKYISNQLEVLCFTSSMAVYGYPLNLPVTEKHQTEPIWLYGQSKLTCEKLLSIHSTKYQINTVILRICGVYGFDTQHHQNAIPAFIRKSLKNEAIEIKGNGQTTRDYIHISDVIKGIFLALKAKKSRIYNLGSGEGWSIEKIAQFIVKKCTSESPIRFNELSQTQPILDYISDISRIKQELGFSPSVSIKEGIVREIEWIKGNEFNR